MKDFAALAVPISFAAGEANEAFRALTGERTWPAALHPEDRERVEAAVAQASAAHERVHINARLHDGRAVCADGVAVDGQTYALTWQEVPAPPDAAARFVTFMNHVPTVASLKDSDGRYVWVNRAFERYTGLTLEQLRGKTPHAWMPPDRADESQATTRAVVESLETLEEVAAIPGPDGAVRQFLNTVFPVVDATGIHVGLVAKDITELVEHEHALEYSAQLQHTVVDLGRRILRGLPDFLAVTCDTVTLMLGTARTVVMEHDQAAADDDGASFSLGMPIPSDGMLVTYNATPREFTQSEIDFLESVANLLSAAMYRRRAEEERASLQEQLEQTRRAASVSRLGTTVAHEFNNVLMSISPFAEIISRGSRSDERLLKAATYIRSAIERGRRVTQDIMRFTRPAEPARRTIDIATWLPGIVQSTLQGSSVRRSVDVPEPPLYANVDPPQLEQVVANVLINAREAMADRDEGGIRVSLSSAHGAIRLRVDDDGCGISPENVDKLFEPFFTTKRSGTGLGLAVAQQIIEKHGGTLEVISRGSAGTAFVINLPPAVQLPVLPVAVIDQSIRGRRLLLVEDEMAVADGMVALLESGEAAVRVAATGRQAVSVLEHESPDAVLLDVGLPDIDGVDLFGLIRKRWPALPIIFSTGHGDQARLDEMLRLPHVGHLVKPFGLDDLTVAVANAIAE